MAKLKGRAALTLEVIDACNALRQYASTGSSEHLERVELRMFALYEKQLKASGVVSNVSCEEFWDIDFMRHRKMDKRGRKVA